jgi:hypothetical protein
MSCHRHTYCQGCEDEANALLFFIWSGVVISLLVLAWVAFT